MVIRTRRYQLLATKALLITLYTFIAGCYSPLEWMPPDYESKPTINSIIKSGEQIAVKVSLTAPYNTQPLTMVDNAQVLLFSDEGACDTLRCTGDGLYIADLLAKDDMEYECQVSIPNYPTAIGSTRIPKHSHILNIEHINKAGVNEEGLTFPAIRITFDSTPNVLTYYHVVIRLFIQDDMVRQAELERQIDPILLNEGLPIAIFSNELIVDNSYAMHINYKTGSAHNHNNTGWVTDLYPLQVELRTLCPNFYQFIKTQFLYEEATGSSIFSIGATPSYNLYSNVENGYGIFAGYSSVKSEIIYP